MVSILRRGAPRIDVCVLVCACAWMQLVSEVALVGDAYPCGRCCRAGIFGAIDSQSFAPQLKVLTGQVGDAADHRGREPDLDCS
jgi:hypothetical protein